jgi:hypothetical protein
VAAGLNGAGAEQLVKKARPGHQIDLASVKVEWLDFPERDKYRLHVLLRASLLDHPPAATVITSAGYVGARATRRSKLAIAKSLGGT